MFGGGGGLNPSKMKQMMEQMGIDVQDIDAEEVIIRTADDELVFTDADVQRMDAQGQQTYQIVGKPEHRDRDDTRTTEETAQVSNAVTDDEEPSSAIPDADVEIVAQRTGSSEKDAREALEAVDGDLAAAVARLE